jgi:hypothetical protein
MKTKKLTTLHVRKPINRSPLRRTFLLTLLALVCFELVQNTQAVSPPPDGGYSGGNTAEGQNALLSLTSGTWNTAVGFSSLKSNTIGNLNTAIGINALSLNTTGINNTANGGNALYLNTTGYQNTANGVYALFRNTTGIINTAMGAFALRDNTTGGGNTAVGEDALLRNTTGGNNTAIGILALWDATTGGGNTAVGSAALSNPGLGNSNTAVGAGALYSGGGDFDTALGAGAGDQGTTGSYNIFIGAGVRGGALQENNTIHIGDNLPSDPGASACHIGGIYGQTPQFGGIAVYIDQNSQLGTVSSSRRFKKDIQPMEKTSEAILALKPVTFHYKNGGGGMQQFGLIAEDVAGVSPDLVVRDKDGKPFSVRYEAVNAMLLNEFLKEHRKNEQLTKDFQSKLAVLQKQIETLTAGLQKVSDQLAAASPSRGGLEANKPTPQVVANDQ